MGDATYGVLVHGAGWVSRQHIAALQANPATRVVAICSRTLESARRRADEAGLRDVALFDDLDRALAHPGVDIVAICTPQHLHCANVLAAAAAGKHLIIEKPVGLSPAELRAEQEAVAAAGVRTVVSFVLRWNPLFQRLKKLIAAGAIGTPYSVEADYLSHCGGWWAGWGETHTRAHGVSAMLVAGCHAIDALRWFAAPGEFAAADPVEVFALAGGWRQGGARSYNPLTHEWAEGLPPMEFEGLEVALVRFANGVVGKVSVNFDCVMPYRFPVRVFGDRGTILDHRVWSRHGDAPATWLELDEIQPDSSDVSHHPFQAEIDHFVACLQAGVESHCNLADACKTHAVVFAAQECYRTGRPVRLGGE